MATIVVNGQKITGNNISVINNRIMVDGENIPATGQEVLIQVTGDVESIHTDNGNIKVHGNVDTASTVNGDVKVKGQILGSAKTVNGDITSTQ